MSYLLRAIALFAVFLSTQTFAVDIQKVETKIGEVWLVESHSLPMVSAQVTFRAGSAFDKKGQEGLASFAVDLMSEATEELPKAEFATALEDKGIGLGASADKLNVTFSLKTLSEYKSEAFGYLADVILRPRLDVQDAKRLKSSLLAGLKQSQEDASYLAARGFNLQLYGAHGYGQPTTGYMRTVEDFTIENVKQYKERMLGYKNMHIAVVGDIKPEELKTLINKAFDDMPKGKAYKMTKAPEERFPTFTRISRPIPQSHILLGHLGLSRDNPDYFAAYVMNYILGGGGFSSRLMQKVRVENGLAYSVYSYFEPMPHKGAFVVGLQTKNASAQKAITLVKEQMKKIKRKGITQAEYKNAINFLTGSFPMRLDTSDKLLGYLSMMQTENVPFDYLETWVKRIQEVSLIDVNNAAQKYLQPEYMVVMQVGGEK